MNRIPNIRRILVFLGNTISFGSLIGEKLKKLGIMLVIGGIVLGFLTIPVYADWPDCGCNNSNDVNFTRVWLGDASGNDLESCTPGDSVITYIWATFANTTHTDRYAVRVLGEMYIDDQLNSILDKCVLDTLPPGTDDYPLYGPFTWVCGEDVKILNLTIRWKTSPSTCGETEPPSCQDYPPAKCYGPVDITVETLAVQPVPTLGVQVIAPAGQSASPGDSISYSFTVKNTGNTSDTYNLTAQSQHGWSVSSPSSISLSAGEKKTVKVTLKVPSTAADGSTDDLTLTAVSQTNSSTQDSDSTTTTIKAPQLTFSKEVSKSEAERGDLLIYYLTIKNNGSGTAYNPRITDTLPSGLSYLKDSSALNGISLEDPAGTNPYTWTIPDISGNSQIILSYRVMVTPYAPYGEVKNQAELSGSNIPQMEAVSSLKIVKGDGPLEQKGMVWGTVFEDINNNSGQDSGEPGLANVEIRLDGPRMVKTDKSGRYKFEEVERGRHVVALDPRTLPEGYVLTSSDSEFVNLAPGQTKKVDFTVQSLYGKIVGTVFLDVDRDGKRDPDTIGISGVSIVLNDNIVITTDQEGNFEFDNLSQGEYELRLDTEKLGKDYRLTTDEILKISLSPGEIIFVDFGLQPRPHLIIKVE